MRRTVYWLVLTQLSGNISESPQRELNSFLYLVHFYNTANAKRSQGNFHFSVSGCHPFRKRLTFTREQFSALKVKPLFARLAHRK